MTRFTTHSPALLLAALVLPTGANAQSLQSPAPTPTPSPPASLPLPNLPAPLPTFVPVLPAAVATPTPAPTVRARATPRPNATGASPTPEPTVRMTRVRQIPVAPRIAAPTPTPSATPSDEPSVEPFAAPTPVESDAVDAAPAVAAAGTEEPSSGIPTWALVLGAALLAGAVALYVLRLRRREAQTWASPEDEPVSGDVVEADDVPAVAPAAAVPAVPASAPMGEEQGPRARLSLDVSPRRAGVNLLTATVDLDVAVENVGAVRADAVRVAVTLSSADADGERALAARFAGPAPAPAVAPFALEPGERRSVRVLTTLPRSEIRELTAGGRPMFVPVVAIDVRYRSGEAEGQTAQAFAVGGKREGSDKLAPFWLDGPPRTSDQVAMRPHGAVLER